MTPPSALPSPPVRPSVGRTEQQDRLRWPDVAKGACILLVVLHHVILKDYTFLVGAVFDPVEDGWHDLTYALKPVRMPLFFVVSGFFAAGAVSRPWRASWRRIVTGYYLYVVWLGVFVGVYAVDRDIPANRVVSPADLVGELLWAASSMWFLYALAAYFVVARLVRSLPPWLVVGAAALLSASVSGLGIEENNRFAVLAHLVYFLVGACCPQLLRRVAERQLPVVVVVVAAASYVAVVAIALYSPLPWSLTSFVASVVGVPLGIRLAVRAADTSVGHALAWVGRRTLRLYVLHLVVLVGLGQLPFALGEDGALGLVAAIGYPVAMSALVVGGCLVVHDVLVRLGAGWLFTLPAALDQRLAAPAAATPASASIPVARPGGDTGQPAPTDAAPGAKVPSDARSGSTE